MGGTETIPKRKLRSLPQHIPPAEPGPEPARTQSHRFRAWLGDRLGLSALRYKVPAHADTIWYTLGGITFIGIFVLVVTGFRQRS